MDFNITKSGYDKTQVDAYFTRISEAYKTMYSNYQDLESKHAQLILKNEQLVDLNNEQLLEIAEMRTQPENQDSSLISRVLIKAQKMADQMIDQARHEANVIVTGAQAQSKAATSCKNETVRIIESAIHQINELINQMGGKESEQII